MKIIDLLVDTSKGKVYENIWFKSNHYKLWHGDYYSDVLDKYLFADEIIDLTNLNDEVEISEEVARFKEEVL